MHRTYRAHASILSFRRMLCSRAYPYGQVHASALRCLRTDI